MTKLNLVLVLALIASGLLLVRTSYEARRLFAELDKAKNEQRRLDAEYRRLDAERQTQATHLRVERVARDKLAMRPATPAVTAYVTDGAALPLAPAAAIGAAAGASR
jgi:cell division protein FtsL